MDKQRARHLLGADRRFLSEYSAKIFVCLQAQVLLNYLIVSVYNKSKIFYKNNNNVNKVFDKNSNNEYQVFKWSSMQNGGLSINPQKKIIIINNYSVGC